MATDPLQLEMEHFDFRRQNEFIAQISTKSEVDDLSDVNKFLDAQQTATTEDPASNISFICGTCGAGFVSYNHLKMHDRIHMKGANGNSTLLNIRVKNKGKSHHNTMKLIPFHKRPKKCEECGKILSSNKTWTHHVMSFHRGQYKFKCTMCSYGCQTMSHLRRHIKKHSVKNEGWKCFKCDRFFTSEAGRSHHILKCSFVLVQKYEQDVLVNQSNDLLTQ